MLFNYIYVKHDVEKLQLYLDHLVKEVWCKAAGDFTIDLLHPDLRGIVIAVAENNKIKIDLAQRIQEIFDYFKELPAEYQTQISEWYDANNNIEALCLNDPKSMPATYADIELIDAELAEKLKWFCDDLLWEKALDWGDVKSKIGEVSDHYKTFVKTNSKGKCPYCGFGGIKGRFHSKQEAYDHFLPKGLYPFNSVNFKNLAPICHECNSSYKLALDPIRQIDPQTRKNIDGQSKAFYSYSNNPPNIEIVMIFNTPDLTEILPKKIDLKFKSNGRDQEVETWKNVFGIEERYRAVCCEENEGKYWLMQALDECVNAKKTPQEILQKIGQNAQVAPWAEANFLKKPFLDACNQIGIFNP